jgi:hypothetical protein
MGGSRPARFWARCAGRRLCSRPLSTSGFSASSVPPPLKRMPRLHQNEVDLRVRAAGNGARARPPLACRPSLLIDTGGLVGTSRLLLRTRAHDHGQRNACSYSGKAAIWATAASRLGCPISLGFVMGRAACSSRVFARPSQNCVALYRAFRIVGELRWPVRPSTPMETGLPSVNAEE